MGKIWVADSEPNERLTLYTRGNVGEVFPHVMTALTGTLVGESLRAGQTEVLADMGVLRPHEMTGDSVGTGVFGGYLYMNCSAFRLFGIRMPGMNWRQADELVMGDAADIPDYVLAKGDRNLLGSLAIVRSSMTMLAKPDLTHLDRARVDAKMWLAGQPDLSAASDDELLDWLATFPERQATSMQRLLQTGLLVGAPRGILDQILDRKHTRPGLVNRMVGGTGDIDSARLAQRLWTLGRLVAEDPALTRTFDEGLDDVAARTASSDLQPAIDEFLADHGHRGNDEYELATLPWVMDAGPVYAAIDRLRHAAPERDPIAAGRRLTADADVALQEALRNVPRPLRRLIRRCAHVARQGSIGRERAKDILVLENLGARRVLHELVRRAAERGGPSDPRLAFCITVDELPDYVARPGDFAEVIAERAETEAYLNARLPPSWFDKTMPDPSTWTLRSEAAIGVPEQGATLSGIAVSGGVASGPARVITDPGDPRGLEPGEVLVCAITDPSWTPLFLVASAVVCDTGALVSHAAIVARELGIPGVMSVPAITSVADGTMLHVDGDAGTVRIGDPVT